MATKGGKSVARAPLSRLHDRQDLQVNLYSSMTCLSAAFPAEAKCDYWVTPSVNRNSGRSPAPSEARKPSR